LLADGVSRAALRFDRCRRLGLSVKRNRASAFFYRYRQDVLGWDNAKARADMDATWHPEGV
jgi:hypothetical protein